MRLIIKFLKAFAAFLVSCVSVSVLDICALVFCSTVTVVDLFSESHDSGNFYFCFRWILIHFKREFHFHEIHRLWEVSYSQSSPLFLCLKIGRVGEGGGLLLIKYMFWGQLPVCVCFYWGGLCVRHDVSKFCCSDQSVFWFSLYSVFSSPITVRAFCVR